jgi:hypothetical protein
MTFTFPFSEAKGCTNVGELLDRLPVLTQDEVDALENITRQ